MSLRESHTLPVPEWAWRAHADALSSTLKDLAMSNPSVTAGFGPCKQEVAETARLAGEAVSLLLATQPFAPFDHEGARRSLRLITDRVATVADCIDEGAEVEVDLALLKEAERWRLPAGTADLNAALRETFAMADSPIDPTGLFRPDWVLAHYAYQTPDLLRHVFPHLSSLGVPGLTDVLAAVTVVGEIASSFDPVTAYVQFVSFVDEVGAADHTTSVAVLRHLVQTEPAMQRARSAAARSSQTVRDAAQPSEVRANALADSYKRLVEGPFRQFVWALHSLAEGEWRTPPTLGVLRDRVVAAGGGLAQVTIGALIPQLRNSEAHETLVWDGFAEQFVAEDVQISPQRVIESAHLAQSFVAGCEAGLAVVRFWQVPESPPLLPEVGELGRMPEWRRVQAFFGTNRLRLLEANLNTRHATLRVARLRLTDINPCLQALVLSHRLMPDIELFSVGIDGTSLIEVDSDALASCMPAWEFAVSNLDQIPLCTFLPANLSARVRHEIDRIAIRSAAWIAVDDAVGVIDGSLEMWGIDDRRLVAVRLHVVELATQAAEAWLGAASSRLRSVAASVAALRVWVEHESPTRRAQADRQGELALLRTQWQAWGPVPRHPLISDEDDRDPSERQPRLRMPPESLAFRLL